jgi:flagellar basal-body rod protein FlgC
MSSLNISASGLAAQRARLDVIAENLANAETTRTPDGGPYQRQQAVLAADPDGGVKVSEVVADPRPPQRVYEPGNPDADAAGYVAMPNVNPVEEMVDLVTATRAYEANVTAFNAGKAMTRKALEIGRG